MPKIPRRALDGILLLDKPLGLSSNQALQKARRLFQAEKAGHTGSLDPLATGMLPVCFGEATKLCGLLLDSDKAYVARVRLGARTSTGDAEGEVIEASDASRVRVEDFERLMPRFLGCIRQVPPMYSALKHQGRRLYELAREGEQVERAPREVHIHALAFGPMENGELDLTVRCSKGTYIRTLAEDLAAALGQCAHLVALRRTAVHPFEGRRCWAWDELESRAASGLNDLDATLLPLAAAVTNWRQLGLDAERLRRMSLGQAVEVGERAVLTNESPIAVLDEQGRLRAIAAFGPDGRLHPRRWLGGAVAG